MDTVDEFDPAIITLCDVINEFPGVTTVESCQGYIDDHRPGQPWNVYFRPDGLISFEAYRSIEFLAWLLGKHELGSMFDATLVVSSPPPHLNTPGCSMTFCIKGRSGHPDELAARIREMRKRSFVTVEEWNSPDDEQ